MSAAFRRNITVSNFRVKERLSKEEITDTDAGVIIVKVKVKVRLRPTVSRPAYLAVRHPYWTRDQFLSSFL
jgi:hypothetical protein